MKYELLLLRHGKSDWSTGDDDFHRPLKDRGKHAAQRIGVWLAQQKRIPDIIISSPAERALNSAHKCCKAMGYGVTRIKQDKRLYLAEPADLLQVLADCPGKARRIMLVGHNPGFEWLLRHLANSRITTPKDGKLLPTATLACLESDKKCKNLRAGDGELLHLIRATTLPKKFPYPLPAGKEQRDRPAYYYTQSSVIPYRINKGQLQILIVRSSKKKHWIIPKGIAEPGYSLQDSAKKEAWEEAGVEGKVSQTALGSYLYIKWGAQCTVSVYPMRVSRELAEKDWQESHRGRRWVSVKEAGDCLRQEQLQPLLKQLQKQLQ